MPNCEYCDKPLVAIGTARGNGKRSHTDWDTRKYHKKCTKVSLIILNNKMHRKNESIR